MIPEKIDYITRKSRLSAGKFQQGEPSTYTIHSTANPKSTAQKERDNLENNAGSASFHSVVDEKRWCGVFHLINGHGMQGTAPKRAAET